MAGLLHKPSGADQMKRIWPGLTFGEQRRFMSWAARRARVSTTLATLVDANGCLNPAAAAEIRATIARFNLKPGQVMGEMGYNPLNTQLNHALNGVWPLPPDFRAKLAKWLDDSVSR